MAIKVTPKKKSSERDVVSVKTKAAAKATPQGYMWWKANTKMDLCNQVIDTVAYLKENQLDRMRQASVWARMYGNMPLGNFIGTGLSAKNVLNPTPVDRPTMNLIQSCVDTLCSRLTQSKPRPVFLTDNGKSKQRSLAKQLNQFILGEFHETKAYEKGERTLRDSAIIGSGAVKVFRTVDDKVGLERVLVTELYVDPNDAYYGEPRCMYHIKLVDRTVLQDMFPKDRGNVNKAEQAYPDNSGDSQRTVSDQVMMIEAWRLPSAPEAGDGKHVICCTAGILLDEEYDKETFPFVFMHYNPRLVGLWSQGLTEQLSGTQIEINKILITISKSISLVGVPRVFIEDGSKVVKAQLNNEIGALITYRGVKPSYEVAPVVPQEMYAQLQRLIDYGYQQSGVSALAATSQKPQGLNSGQAIRTYDDLQSDRFATLAKRYEQFYKDLAYKIIEEACDIVEDTGKYETVYPGKDGTQSIELPDAEDLMNNPYVIQCYDESFLPKDPAGRRQTVVEDMQAGIISPDEGRRLLNYPDLEQEDKLKFAAEERVLKMLDDIVDSGKYTPPDPYTNIQLGIEKVTQYYNMYTATKDFPESKAQKLRTWHQQCLSLQQAAMPPPMPGAGAPQAAPEAPQTNPMIPNIPQQ
jgi:hypothetical protein